MTAANASGSEGPRIDRLRSGDERWGERVFAVMAEVFDEDHSPLSADYVVRLLASEDFWVYAAVDADDVVGGLTAHALPMTRSESTELFIYDIAVRRSHQRRGIGRALVQALLRDAADAGIDEVFVPADNDDTHALDFYRSLGGAPSDVTFFDFRAT